VDAGAKLDAYLRRAQQIVHRAEGAVLQLTIGDKGSFFYAVFGAPLAHDDDPHRAVRAALELQSVIASPEGAKQSPIREAEIASSHSFDSASLRSGSLLAMTTRVGIAQGQMRVGAYGGTARRTYGAMGDATNLAARLMQAAPVGEIRCDYNVYRAASKRIAFETLSPIRVKGKAGLVRVYKPTSGQPPALSAVEGSAVSDQQSTIIGRRAEIATIEKMLDEAQVGATRVLIVEGEAGIGKSRLVDELKRAARERGLVGLIGNGQSIEQQTPYRAWRDVFNSYFELDAVSDANERRTRIESLIPQLIPDHAQRLPVLNDVLGLGIPENELTQSLDANLRQQNVTLVLTALLRAWTNERPLILVLEDAHWLDGLSWQLALQIVRASSLARAPLLFVLVNRPLDENSVGQKVFAELCAMSITQTLALGALAPDNIVALLANRLNVTPDALPAPLIELVQARANGNPFFAEELVFNLRDTGVIQTFEVLETSKVSVRIIGDLEIASRTLPDTLHGLILARIDRLPSERQFVIKVAAVIGRAFAYTPLQHVVTQYATMIDESLKAHLTALTQADFTFVETLEPDLTYLFKHIITQEAAYQTLLFSQRRELHRLVAEWYETSGEWSVVGGQRISSLPTIHYPLLAYHYRYAEDAEKERHYLGLAGEAAEKTYANDAAIGFYTRLLDVTLALAGSARVASEAKQSPPANLELASSQSFDSAAPRSESLRAMTQQEQADILLKRAAIFELVGRGQAAEQDYRAALKLAEQTADPGLIARSQFALGELFRRRGDYVEALESYKRAQANWESLNNLSGRIRTLIGQGNVLSRKGDYAAARTLLELGLQLARESNDRMRIAEASGGLAYVDSQQGNLLQAEERYKEQLKLARELNQKKLIADGLDSLAASTDRRGDLAAAQLLLLESLAIRREIGDRLGIASSLTNLGVVVDKRDDWVSAQRFYEEGLAIMREIGNKAVIANMLKRFGTSLRTQGNYAQAEICLQESLALAQAIGEKTLIALVLNELGTLARDQGKHSVAQTFLQSALELQRVLGVSKDIGGTLNSLGMLALLRGDYAEAHRWLDQALAMQRQVGSQRNVAIALTNLTLAVIGLGDYKTARTLYRESIAIVRELKIQYSPPYILIGLTAIVNGLGLFADAARFSSAVETWRAASVKILESYELGVHERSIAEARAALNPAEFDAAWAQGAQMTLDQAIDEALKVTEQIM